MRRAHLSMLLSGGPLPLSVSPTWLNVVTRLNPLTYAVAPLRQVVFAVPDVPPMAAERSPATVTLFGYTLPAWLALAMVAAFAVVFFALAV